MGYFFETLIQYFSIPFVVYSFIVGIVIAFSSSLFSTSLVLKRHSMIGDGLSHIAFGAVAVAAVLDIAGSDMIIIMPVTILAAIVILKIGKNSKIKGDATIAMLSVGSLSFGYLLMNIFPVSSNVSGDVCNSLFGSTDFLNLDISDVIFSLIMCGIVLILFIINYNKIFAVTFDEDFSHSCGVNIDRVNLLTAIITAVVIVVSMKLVGALLISALIVFPPISAMRICKCYFSTVVCSSIISVLCVATGIIASIFLKSPIGATVAVINVFIFILCAIVGKFKGKNA